MGDEEVYPEHEKLAAVKERSQACGEFLDWLMSEKGYCLAYEHEHMPDCVDGEGVRVCGSRKGELLPVAFNMRKLLSEFFEIDEERLEDEKVAMLEDLKCLGGKP